MKQWKPRHTLNKEIIELVNKKYIASTSSLRRPAENRDIIIDSMGFDLLRREIEVEHYRNLVREIWDSYINLMKKNPMTEEEQKGYGNYEKRLFDIFWKEVGNALEEQHDINYKDIDIK